LYESITSIGQAWAVLQGPVWRPALPQRHLQSNRVIAGFFLG
jgi:hypothetical protein